MSLTDKVLKSGLVDRHTAEMMERWGYLRPGSAEQVNENALKDATKAQLTKLAEELDDEIDAELRRRETRLDLDKLRWPVEVDLVTSSGVHVSMKTPAVVDRVGRYYFRMEDVDPEWFVPGYLLKRTQRVKTSSWETKLVVEEVLEATVLYSGESAVCVQVTARPVE